MNRATDFTIGPLSLDLPDLAPGQCLIHYLVLNLVSGNETAYPGILVKPDLGSWFGCIPITICEPEGLPTGTLILRKLAVNHRGQTPESNPAAPWHLHPFGGSSTRLRPPKHSEPERERPK